MGGELEPTEGSVKRHQHLAIGRYHQHSADVLGAGVLCFICLFGLVPSSATPQTRLRPADPRHPPIRPPLPRPDDALSPLVFMRKAFPPETCRRSEEVWRSYLAQFGFSTAQQTAPIGLLSGGQKSRLVFAMLAMKEVGLLVRARSRRRGGRVWASGRAREPRARVPLSCSRLPLMPTLCIRPPCLPVPTRHHTHTQQNKKQLLDEPTNHLDLDAVDGLADAIRKFDGGVVLVSHDFRLIGQVAKEIWLCDGQGVSRYDGSIQQYKKELAKAVARNQ